MADITSKIQGFIGNEDVDLTTNAASEVTLRQLLQATIAIGTKNEKALNELAKSAGYDVDKIEKLNDATGKTTTTLGLLREGATDVNKAFNETAKYVRMFESSLGKLSNNTGKASEQLDAFKSLPLGIGAIAEKSAFLLKFQEANFESYQKLTTAGVNLAGNLGKIRDSAGQMYLTLDQFSKLMSENGPSFARLGTTANQGAEQFIKLSSRLQQSKAGEDLRALGISAEELNEAQLKYLSSTGGRTRKELENTEAITKSTVDYLTELDKLTQFTGVSRKKIEEEQKKADLNQAFQRKMASLGEAERVKLKAAYDKAAASGIEGATDLVMSAALNMPPITEAAKNLQGIAAPVADGFREMTQSAMQVGTTLDQQNQIYGTTLQAASDVSKNLGSTGDALALMNGKFGSVTNSLIGVENLLRDKGLKTAGEIADAYTEIVQQQKTQQNSSAKTQVEIESMLYQTSKAVNRAIQSMVDDALPGLVNTLRVFTNQIKSLADMIANNPSTANYAYDAYAIAAGVAEAVVGGFVTNKILDRLAGKEKTLGTVKEEPVAKMSEEAMAKEKLGKMGEFGSPKKALTAVEEAALRLKPAVKAIKGTAIIGTAVTIGMAANDLDNISKAAKEGKISKEEASRQKGKVAGGAVGGAAGGWAGAEAGAFAGAALGTLLFPVGGTVVGGLLGGIIGGLGGAWVGEELGSNIGENLTASNKQTQDLAQKTAQDQAIADTKKQADMSAQKAAEDAKIAAERARDRMTMENLLAGINKLNTTMDKVLVELKATSVNTELTAREIKGGGLLKKN
jgi:hypothetical protein